MNNNILTHIFLEQTELFRENRRIAIGNTEVVMKKISSKSGTLFKN